MDISSVEGTIVEYQGVLWILGSPSVTSDGFVTAWGTPSDGEFEDGHSFFLGQAPTRAHFVGSPPRGQSCACVGCSDERAGKKERDERGVWRSSSCIA